MLFTVISSCIQVHIQLLVKLKRIVGQQLMEIHTKFSQRCSFSWLVEAVQIGKYTEIHNNEPLESVRVQLERETGLATNVRNKCVEMDAFYAPLSLRYKRASHAQR